MSVLHNRDISNAMKARCVSHSLLDILRALTTNKVWSGLILTNRITPYRSTGEHYFPSLVRINEIHFLRVRLEYGHLNNGFSLNEISTLFNIRFVNGKPIGLISKTSLVSCKSTGANNSERKNVLQLMIMFPILLTMACSFLEDSNLHIKDPFTCIEDIPKMGKMTAFIMFVAC